MSEEQEELLRLLGEAWALCPSLRLGQIVINVSGVMHGQGEDPCAYGTPDSTMKEGLTQMIDQLSGVAEFYENKETP